MGPSLPTTAKPQDLLCYNETYRILICTACEYAIQPSAIARHLKEIHAIHRHHRRPYTDYAASLALSEPSDLADSDVADFPVPGLPVINGLQCLSPRCGHLCATTKRMQSHWVGSHGASGCAALDWQPVPLQTFFRGNLLRYFTHPAVSVTRQPIEPESMERFSTEVRQAWVQQQDLDVLDELLLDSYLRSTCFSLANRHGNTHLWQISIPQIAADSSFLRHGILALSAIHLSGRKLLSDVGFDHQQLMTAAHSHQAKAMAAFQEATAKGQSTALECHSIIAFIHLHTLYSFATWLERDTLSSDDLLLVDSSRPDLLHLTPWLYYVRHGCQLVCGFWDTVGNGPLATLVLSWDISIMTLDEKSSKIANLLLSTIRSVDDGANHLPIQEVEDLALALSAADRMGAALTIWDAIRLWPLTVSTEFIDKVHGGAPGSLTLLGCYCIILERLDRLWFADGLAASLLANILSRLQAHQQQALHRLRAEILLTLTQQT